MKRYDINPLLFGCFSDVVLIEHPTGEYVDYSDVEAEIEKLKNLNTEMLEMLKRLIAVPRIWTSEEAIEVQKLIHKAEVEWV